jgi:hypothetical protein
LPVLISLGLVTWLVWSVSPRRLLDAFSTLNWPWLVLATVVQVVVLFGWDTLCLWWLFSQPDRRLPFRTVLRVRTDTVIWSAVNLEVGQGAFAWQLARAEDVPVTATLGRCFLLALVDTGTLLSLALVGSFLRPYPQTRPFRWVCVGGLAGLGGLVAAVRLLPDHWRGRLTAQPWAGWLGWFDRRHALRLGILRLTLFLLVLVYAGVGLAMCGIPVGPLTVVGIIPFVLIAESLPGTGGLGERETALVYLYPWSEEHRAVLLSFGLIWSTVTILGRVAIGLISWSLPHSRSGEGAAPLPPEPQSARGQDFVTSRASGGQSG